MLMSTHVPNRLTPYLSLTVVLFVIVFSGCKCTPEVPKDWTTYQIKSPYEGIKPDPYKQMIVWLKPGTARQDFNRWLQDSIVKNENNELKVRFVCGSCDSTLFLLEGKGVELYMQGELVKGGTSSSGKPKVTGESGPLFYSTNIPVRFPEQISEVKGEKRPPLVAYADSLVKVAVFDTGLDTTLVDASFLYRATDSSCLPGASEGWNFTAGNSSWVDDNPGRHGTTVTGFITREVERYQKNKVAILPVKIFSNDGTSDLYNILCGFAYAKNRKVNVINASFGYYESIHKFDSSGNVLSEPTSPVLLRAFIEEYLTRNNILLIAAAGNKDDALEDPEYNPADTLQKRNLDSVHFYPASLSPVLPNVVAITTVYKDMVSPTQNFSNKIVDAGVHADGIDNSGHFYFSNPLNAALPPVSGSSFATPVATGKFASWYALYKHLLGAPITFAVRDSIFSILKSQPIPVFLYIQPGLSNRVKDGKVINKSFEANQQTLAVSRK